MPSSQQKEICSIIMPISAMDGCDTSHWSDVKGIVEIAIDEAGFEANLVSDTDDIGEISKFSIMHLYSNPVVICDVSAKSPKVMLELGMRLAFDQPTIVIKDDASDSSFDTATVRNITYPRDLRYTEITSFKKELAGAIKNAAQDAKKEQGHSAFLAQFGEFTIPQLETKEISGQEFIIEQLKKLTEEVAGLKLKASEAIANPVEGQDLEVSKWRKSFPLQGVPEECFDDLMSVVMQTKNSGSISIDRESKLLTVDISKANSLPKRSQLNNRINEIINRYIKSD